MSDFVRSRWSLSPEAFDSLLAALGPERALAAEEYEALRRRLVHHFAWQQQRDPETMADEVLNRIARKLSEGMLIEDHRQYAFGIARLLLLETKRNEMRERKAFVAGAYSVDAGMESKFTCLEKCLGNLRHDNKELILSYYQGEKRNRIEARMALSARLGLELNALRNRALRIRLKLEACLCDCLQCDESVNPDSNDREKF